MKKLFTFLAGAALLGSLSACSSDEPAKGPDSPDVTTGDAAYLAVRIIGADGTSRTVEDGNYEFGEGQENKVANAKFFFFDGSGNYVLEAKVVNDPSTENGDKDTNNNIELKVKTVLVLDGLQNKGAAVYMLTILNAPDFTPENTLNATLQKTTNWATPVEGQDPYFVMSTSSYIKGENTDKHHDDNYYYVTKLDIDDYKDSATEAQADANTVDVYVERLAAKIDFEINISDANKKKENVTVKDGKDKDGNDKTVTTTIYQLSQTVGGGPNEGNPVATTPLYIAVLDWNIGGITSDSYMCKNIDSNWSFTSWASNTQNVTWNDPTRFRSYWAKSTVYGKDIINTNLLSYATSKNLVSTSSARYCNENTNVTDKIFIRNGATAGLTETTTAVNPELVTHATIRAKICDEKGNDLNMVMANGVLFRQEEYIKRILSRYTLDNTHTIGILVKDEEKSISDNTVYKEIDENYFIYVPEKETGNAVGQTIFKFDDSKKTGTTFYKQQAAGTTPKYAVLEGEELNTAISTLNSGLLAEQHEYVGADKYATIYDNGNFVYYVPIEHLGAAADNTVASEGYYGVVRNHWYKLSIDEFTKVGHGIWDPNDYEETYKPDGPQEYFYLGARINILSWKIVNQSVKL